jgi:hypothetical protein
LIDISAGKNDALNRGVTKAGSGMKKLRCFDLQTQIGRGAQQKPLLVIVSYRNLGLSSSGTLEGPGTQGLAMSAVAIPLGETTPCGRAQDFNAHNYIAALA